MHARFGSGNRNFQTNFLGTPRNEKTRRSPPSPPPPPSGSSTSPDTEFRQGPPEASPAARHPVKRDRGNTGRHGASPRVPWRPPPGTLSPSSARTPLCRPSLPASINRPPPPLPLLTRHSPHLFLKTENQQTPTHPFHAPKNRAFSGAKNQNKEPFFIGSFRFRRNRLILKHFHGAG
jgi:hypothetical protein